MTELLGVVDPAREPRVHTISESAEGLAIPIVLGTQRVSGRPFVITSAADGRLVVAYALCSGPISSITSYTLGGQTPAIADVTLETYTGTAGQSISTILSAAISGYTQTHPRLAYIVASIGPQSPLWGSIPDLVAIVAGRNDVYNPRLGGGYLFTGNPALLAAHLAVDIQAGGWSSASIDWDRVGAVADFFDTSVGGVNRNTLGVVINSRQTLKEALQSLLRQCHAYEVWRDGKWSLWTDGAVFPSRNLADANVATGTDQSGATTDWVSLMSAVASSVTTESRQGDRSLRIVTPGVSIGEGVSFDLNVATAGVAHTLSLWAKGTAGATLELAIGANVAAVTMSEEWVRYSLTWTPAGIGGFGAIRTKTTAQAVSIYVDAVQVEVGSSATAWDLPVGGSLTPLTESWVVKQTSAAGSKLMVEAFSLPLDQVPDLVRVRYPDPDRDYEYAESRWPLAAVPSGTVRELEISAPFVTSPNDAQRLAEDTYTERQAYDRLRVTCFRSDDPWERGRAIVVDGLLGMSSVAHRIVSVSPRPDGHTDLVLSKSYSPSVSVGVSDTKSTLPTPRVTDTPAAPTSLSLTVRTLTVGGMDSYEIAAEWTASKSAHVNGYRVDKVVAGVTTTVEATTRTVTKAVIPVTEPGTAHTVNVYAITAAGTSSSVLTGSVTPGGSSSVSLTKVSYTRVRQLALVQPRSGSDIEYDGWSGVFTWSLTDSGSQVRYLEVMRNGQLAGRLPSTATQAVLCNSEWATSYSHDGTSDTRMFCGYDDADTVVIAAVLKDGRRVELNMGSPGAQYDWNPMLANLPTHDLLCGKDATYDTAMAAVGSSPTSYKSPIFNGTDWTYQQIIPTSPAEGPLCVDSNGLAKSMFTPFSGCFPWYNFASDWLNLGMGFEILTIANGNTYVDHTPGFTLNNYASELFAVVSPLDSVIALQVAGTSATNIRVTRSGSSGAVKVALLYVATKA